jgi:two-component system, OmpR family, sensor histidine kinase VicK
MYLINTLIIHYNKSYAGFAGIRMIYLFLFLSLNILFSCHYFSSQPKDHPKFFDQVIETATNLKENGKIDSCFTFLNSKYKQIKNPGPGDLFKKYNFFRYYYLYEKRDYNKAIMYTDSSLKVLEKYADQKSYFRDYATANFYKGDVYFELKKYTDAFQSIYKGKLLTEKIKDPCFLGDYDYRLAMVCYKQMNYLDAVKYFKKAIIDFTFCKKEFVYAFQKQQLYDNIGLSFSKVT